MDRIKPLLPYVLVAAISMAVVLQVYPSAHPYSGLSLPLDAEAVKQKAIGIVKEAQVDPEEMTTEVRLRANTSLIRQLRETVNLSEGNSLLMESVPGFYWEVNFKKRKSFSLGSLTAESSSQDSREQAQKIEEVLRGDILLRLHVNGNLIEYERKVADTAKIASVSGEEAWKRAGELLAHFIRRQEISPKSEPAKTIPGEVGGLLRIGRSAPLLVGSFPEAMDRYFAHPAASIQILSRNLYAFAYPFVFLFLFLLPFLRQRISSPFLLLPISALLFGLTNRLDRQPVVLSVALYGTCSAIIAWSLYKFDVLTAFVALVSVSLLDDAVILLSTGHTTYAEAAYGVFGFLALATVWGFVAVSTKDKISDFESVTPSFARYISERQRLHQELEIARQVQMSFLPKTNPTSYKFDIASRCAPALEVGGDYYDFIEIDRNRLGIAVGDVSGKGTQAAFFMTLTKGFLKALARVADSPASVLTHVNKLFYESVDRGVFISIVYGIFDTDRRTLTVARAGHNPVIVRKTQAENVEIVSPLGLALGLDRGDKFSNSIEEEKIPFQAGDLFVFYTDGFPEAMNKAREEYGQDRLCKAVERLVDKSSQEIMHGIFSEMKSFIGKAPQHDDMTIVVVKVL